MGTCEQRDTGQGQPDKGTGHRSMTISKRVSTFAGMALGPLEGSKMEHYMCDADEMVKMNDYGPFQQASIRHMMLNSIRKEPSPPPRCVPVSNATLVEVTLTKVPYTRHRSDDSKLCTLLLITPCALKNILVPGSLCYYSQ